MAFAMGAVRVGSRVEKLVLDLCYFYVFLSLLSVALPPANRCLSAQFNSIEFLLLVTGNPE